MFMNLKEILQWARKQADYKEWNAILVFTDASDKFWAWIVAQVKEEEVTKHVQYQEHKPLAFPYVRFN